MTACHHTDQKKDRHTAEAFGWLWARLWRVVLCGNRRTWWGAQARLAVRALGQAVPGVSRDENIQDSEPEPSGTDPPLPMAWTHSRRRIAEAPWAQTFAGVSGRSGATCLGGGDGAARSELLSLDTPSPAPHLIFHDRFRF